MVKGEIKWPYEACTINSLNINENKSFKRVYTISGVYYILAIVY
jgi:hypothetical protein